ncbi:MAG: pyruvate kinase [Ignavibacteria bacterium]|nr:MAG: pyruvate kinase [Ignavibacteria bacterium]
MKRRAKIICTLGPASREPETLRELIRAGMNIARLNFSHASHEEHAETIRRIRKVAEEMDTVVAIMQDLQGPKIRTGVVPEEGVRLEDGAPFVITTAALPIGSSERVSTSYTALTGDVRDGQTILLDDGYLSLEVERVDGTEVHTRVRKGGVLRSNKGIIVPGCEISAPPLSEKDVEDLRFGLEAGVDAVALSFVRSERDIIELRTTMKLFGRRVPIIAKIERYEGISDIEDIVQEADGIMVARGDLGVEMPAEQVPVLQKRIIARCNYYGKPVITATQMLESMIGNPRPTRAEASDVANAVLDGTDCVMLSAETSIGSYPVEAVQYMDSIVRAIEESGTQLAGMQHEIPEDKETNVADAIGRASCVIAEQINAAAIVTLTSSGGTARVISKYRPRVPILALSDDPETLKQLAFTWGISPVAIPPLAEMNYQLAALRDIVLATGEVQKGDHVVYSAGSPLQNRASTNMLEVQRL